MVWVPGPLSWTPGSVARPPARFTGVPLFSDVVVDPIVSVKVTCPVGTVEVWPVAVSDTCAVMAVVWPSASEAGFWRSRGRVRRADPRTAERNLLRAARHIERVVGDGNAGAEAAARLRCEGDRHIAQGAGVSEVAEVQDSHRWCCWESWLAQEGFARTAAVDCPG